MSWTNYKLEIKTYPKEVDGPGYRAEVTGPWYDDSNPEGEAETEDGAKQEAYKELRKIRDGINEFLHRETGE